MSVKDRREVPTQVAAHLAQEKSGIRGAGVVRTLETYEEPVIRQERNVLEDAAQILRAELTRSTGAV